MFTPRFIDPLEYAGTIAKALDPGVLLTTRAKGRANTMTIGWGAIGVEWGRPVFVAFVRTHRFTHELLEESGEFTVNVPVGSFDKGILGLCGTRTGRSCDKFALAGLTAVPGQTVAAPAIAQLPPDAGVQGNLPPASGGRRHPARHPGEIPPPGCGAGFSWAQPGFSHRLLRRDRERLHPGIKRGPQSHKLHRCTV